MNLDLPTETLEALRAQSPASGTARWADEALTVLQAPDLRCFEFDRAPSSAHSEFGVQLQEHGIFRLPFPSCLFTYPAETEQGSDYLGYVLASEHREAEKHRWHVTAIYRNRLPGGVHRGMVGAAFMLHEGIRRDAEEHPLLSTTTVITTSPPLLTGESREAAGRARIGHEVGVILGLSASLLSREFVQTQVEAPSKLNKARQAHGRRPLPGFVRITLAQIAAGYVRSDTPSGRNSPRLHWRRGHIRRLPGIEPIAIAPMMVGAGDADIVRDYRVRVREHAFNKPMPK